MSCCMSRRHVLAGLGASLVVSSPLATATAAGTLLDGAATTDWICNARGLKPFKYTGQVRLPSPEAVRAMRWIVDTIGIRPNFEVLEGDFSRKVGAFAVITGGKRYVVYDSAEFDWRAGQANWLETGIIAHEIGHHIGGHTAPTNYENHDEELEADRFAGFALARLGASLAQALLWTADLNETDTPTHPARARRIDAVSEGWHHGEVMKDRERGLCANQWAGSPVTLAGRSCRAATFCEPTRHVRIACKGPSGRWVWQR